MNLWGIDENELAQIIDQVSRDLYDGNLTANRLDRVNGRCVAFTLRVSSSKAPGARRSGSGRRSVAACWHAHRDVMAVIFDRNPAARVKSAFADYRGKEAFEDLFPNTGDHNVGSMMRPVMIEDCCDCFSTESMARYRDRAGLDSYYTEGRYDAAVSVDAFRWSPQAGEDEIKAWAEVLGRS